MKVVLLLLAVMSLVFGILDFAGLTKSNNIIEGLLWINLTISSVFQIYLIGNEVRI